MRIADGMKYVVLCMLAAVANFACAESVGKVITATGTVTAGSRTLKRGNDFNVGEVIKTGANSSVQLRFTDGTLVALSADATYRVDAYKSKEEAGSGVQKVATLMRGGLRSLSEVSGGEKPSNYQVKTPVATIGIRGTLLELFYEPSTKEMNATCSAGSMCGSGSKWCGPADGNANVW